MPLLNDDELTDLDQAIVGSVCRIEIPLRSPSALLQVADLLRGLANQAAFTAQNTELPARTRMLEFMLYCRQVNKRMKKMRGRGRLPKMLDYRGKGLDNDT
jgi:hypothetical protein